MHECNENCQDPCPYEGWEKHQVPEYWASDHQYMWAAVTAKEARIAYERIMAWDAYLDSVEE